MTVIEQEFPPLDGAVYVDSNIFIYLFEDAAERADRAEKLFVQMALAGGNIVTSELTQAECSYKPARDKDTVLIAMYDEFFERSGNVALVALTGAIVKEAAILGGGLGLKLLGAIHYASAVKAGCKILISGDRQFKSGPGLAVIHI